VLILHSKILAGELKEKASEKVDEAKDKASEVAAAAKEKGEGRHIHFFEYAG
jgi:hypothetical protein